MIWHDHYGNWSLEKNELFGWHSSEFSIQHSIYPQRLSPRIAGVLVKEVRHRLYQSCRVGRKVVIYWLFGTVWLHILKQGKSDREKRIKDEVTFSKDERKVMQHHVCLKSLSSSKLFFLLIDLLPMLLIAVNPSRRTTAIKISDTIAVTVAKFSNDNMLTN